MHQVSGFNKEYYFYNFNSVSFKQADNLAFVRNENKDKPVTKPANPFLSKDTLELSGKKIETALKSFDSGAVNFKDISIGLLESIPFVRRYITIEDGKDNNNKFKAFAAALLLLANAPEDARDLKAGINQFLNPKKISSGLGHDYQVKFSFLRGTLFEFLLKGNGKYTKPISEFLYNNDKTLYDSKLWSKLLTILGYVKEEIKFPGRIDVMKNEVPYYKVNAKNAVAGLLARASLRLTLMSLLVFSLFEINNIYNAFMNGKDIKEKIKNGSKQIIKSSVNIVSILSATALTGALLTSKGPLKGPAGSLIGIGLGTYFGSKTSNYINSKIK